MKFEDYFSLENLLKIYDEKIAHFSTMGVDNMSIEYFEKNKIKILNKISCDICANEYRFKPYKVVLIPKKIHKFPRKICIPTIKDKLVIEVLKQIIYDYYEDCNLNLGISNLVSKLINTYQDKKYTRYIKYDLTTFFDLINHKKIIAILKNRIKDERVINLLIMVLQNKQQSKTNKNDSIDVNYIGVPQGLSISMLLANIYLHDIDTYFAKINNVNYYRYVDDVLIFYNKHGFIHDVRFKFKVATKNLRLNKEKTEKNSITNPFCFLGYKLSDNNISVRNESIYRFENSLEQIFKNYKKNGNKYELYLRLNLRIVGAIFNNKRYGWLFYFSYINDLKLLYHLDWLVDRLKARYKVSGIKTRSFVTAYHYIKASNVNNEYFFNFNTYSIEKMINLLINLNILTQEEIFKMENKQIKIKFRKTIFKYLKSLEEDLDNLS